MLHGAAGPLGDRRRSRPIPAAVHICQHPEYSRQRHLASTGWSAALLGGRRERGLVSRWQGLQLDDSIGRTAAGSGCRMWPRALLGCKALA